MLNKLRSGAIYDSITDGDEERVYDYFHASSIAICPRSHYFKRLGIPGYNQPTGAKILRWQAGHSIEEVIRQHIVHVYGECQSNVRYISEELQLSGEYDNLTKDHRLVEIKSVHDMAFIEKGGAVGLKLDTGEKGPRGGVQWAVKDSPYLHHELQNHAYALLLKEQDVTATGIDYVYVSLSGRVVVYTTQINPKYLKWVEDRLALLRKAYKTQTAPDCLCKDFDSPLYNLTYKWCDYKNETDGTCCELIKEKARQSKENVQ